MSTVDAAETTTATNNDNYVTYANQHSNSAPTNSLSQAGNHRKETALIGLDGDITTVKAHDIKYCVPTKETAGFIVQMIVLCGIIVTSITMLIISESNSIQFSVFQSLLTFAIGVLIPSPKPQIDN